MQVFRMLLMKRGAPKGLSSLIGLASGISNFSAPVYHPLSFCPSCDLWCKALRSPVGSNLPLQLWKGHNLSLCSAREVHDGNLSQKLC